MKHIKYLLGCLLLIVTTACTQPAKVQGPPGYDLGQPQVFKMPSDLAEISGITFKNGNPDTIYAEQDEEGKVFLLHPGDKEARVIKFGKRGDYEDIGFYNDKVVLLRSNGTLYSFDVNEVDNGEATNVTEIKDAVPASEYEAMYIDEKNGSIYVLCKDCQGSKKNKTVNGYIINISPTGETSATVFTIDEKQIEDLNGGKKTNLKASAMAKNTQTGEWYILSSVNKILVVADNIWTIKAVYPLSSAFTQPEGIAFDNKNNLYVSNEGAGIGSGTILKFAYQKIN